MRALVIDDSHTVRALLRQILWACGFEVYEAGNGREGLERLRCMGKTDVALVDWSMPVMDGYEFVQAVRADPSYNTTRLMMITAQTGPFQVLQALDAGANAYVVKPFNEAVIRDQLKKLGLM